MKSIAILILMTSIFYSCNNHKKVGVTISCKEVDQIMESDQKYRSDHSTSPVFTVADSLARQKYGDKMIPDDVGEFLHEAHLLTQNTPRSMWVDTVRADSLNALQSVIDDQNTKRLIEIINDASLEQLESADCLKVSLLPFVHSSEKFRKQVRECINKNIVWIGFNRYRHIDWHLTGRDNHMSKEEFEEKLKKLGKT